MDTDTAEITVLPTKKRDWQQAEDRITQIEESDPHGLKIDAGIKKAVIGLNAFGFNTTFSCEGHLDHGYGYPYIRISDREAQQKSRAASDAYSLQRHVEYERLREESDKSNTELLARLNVYLRDFYESRFVSDTIKLAALLDLGNIILKNQGTQNQTEDSFVNRAITLPAYQKEMKDFSDFLEQKFFNN